ncbi:MAG: signal peptidase I [Acidobacteria bacterium]|nr:signal peptidase I [Acidobacteriota bacterium]
MRGWRLQEIGRFCAWIVGSWVVSMALWVAVPAIAMGWEPTVISSGSMNPSLRVGDVVLIDRDSPVGEGDIVAFNSGDHNTVHRVVGTTEEGEVMTKGDANRVDDSASLSDDEIIGRARMVVPFIGKPVLWGAATVLFAVLGLFVVIGVIRSKPEVGVAILVTATAFAALTSTSLAWTRPTANSASSFSAASVTIPTGFTATCGAAAPYDVDVDLSWTSVPGATAYNVLHDPPGGGSGYTVIATVAAPQTTYTHTITSGNGNQRFAVSAVVGTWESDPSADDSVKVNAKKGKCN